MSITAHIDAITRITDSRLCEAPPAPKSVKIELSPRCNYKCGFCALQSRPTQPTEDMDFNLFKRITDDMVSQGVEEIGLFYLGESFMNVPLLVDATRYLKQSLRVPYVFLTSNASLAKPQHVKAIMAAGLDSLKWSVNACDEEQFAKVAGVSPKFFELALDNIACAHAIRESHQFPTRLYASSIRYDGDQQARMETLLDQRVRPFVDESYFLPLYGMAMRSEAIKQAIGYTPTHGNSGRFDTVTGLPNRDPLPCWSAFTEGHVRVDGGLSVCCFGSDARFDAGNLATHSFMEAWHSPKFREIRRAQLQTRIDGPAALKGTMCDVCVAY